MIRSKFLTFISLLIGVSAAASGQIPVRPARAPRHPKADANWSSPGGLAIRGDGTAIFAEGDGAFVALGASVYDLNGFKPFGKIADPYDDRGTCSLSPDGLLFAGMTRHGQGQPVNLWDVHTGKLTLTIPTEATADIGFLSFTEPGVLLMAYSDHVVLIDAATGKTKQSINAAHVSRPRYCLSPGGKYFAVAEQNEISIYALDGGNVVASLKPPAELLRLDNLKGIQFSHSGTELAAVVGFPRTSILVWDSKGEFKAQLHPAINLLDASIFPNYAEGAGLEWLPDDTGWSLEGRCIVDREAGQPRWICTTGFINNGASKLIDQDHLAYAVEHKGVVRVEIPWIKIRAAVKGMASTPAYVSPSQPVSLEVKISAVRFAKPEDLATDLTAVYTQCLTDEGIKVDKDQPAKFLIEYEEHATDPVTFHKMGPGGGKESVEGTAATGKISLITRDGAKVLWTKPFASAGGFLFHGDLTAQSYRQSVFDGAKMVLQNNVPPYFVPRGNTDLQLPVVTTIPR